VEPLAATRGTRGSAEPRLKNTDLAHWFITMGRNPNMSGERSKNGSRRGDPNRSCVFSTLPLHFCVCL